MISTDRRHIIIETGNKPETKMLMSQCMVKNNINMAGIDRSLKTKETIFYKLFFIQSYRYMHMY